MRVLAIPLFKEAHLLRREMLQALSDYAFRANQLLFWGYGDGILGGCELTTTRETIVLNEGVFLQGGQMFLITEPMEIRYYPTNTTTVMKLCLSAQVEEDGFLYREMDLRLTDDSGLQKNELELCRFKLQPGARLRDQYQDFEDRNTEFDTLNRIRTPYSAKEGSTLAPEIFRDFAREMLSTKPSSELDTWFCLRLLEQERPMGKEAVAAYLWQRNNVQIRDTTNLSIYRELVKVLRESKSGLPVREAGPVKKRWSLSVD